jgi:hypothetical protein
MYVEEGGNKMVVMMMRFFGILILPVTSSLQMVISGNPYSHNNHFKAIIITLSQ